MQDSEHYLKRELYDLIRKDSSIFEFLQRGSLDGIWYWNLEMPEDEWMSPGFWELLGYDPEEKEHLASEWKDLIDPDDLKMALENFSKHCADPAHPYDQIVRYRHGDGSTVWVRCRGIAIRKEAGKPVRLLGAHTDLTQLKRTEEQLRTKTIALEAALKRIGSLESILPICAWCKKIRDADDHWQPMETYVSGRTGTMFSHGMCPDCEKDVGSPSEGA